jgi:hypothetical protein
MSWYFDPPFLPLLHVFRPNFIVYIATNGRIAVWRPTHATSPLIKQAEQSSAVKFDLWLAASRDHLARRSLYSERISCANDIANDSYMS